jgi:hypothetical protein
MTTLHPMSDEDTFDLIDDAVAALAERRGAWLGDDLSTIALIASLIEQGERWLPQLVHDALLNGSMVGLLAPAASFITRLTPESVT